MTPAGRRLPQSFRILVSIILVCACALSAAAMSDADRQRSLSAIDSLRIAFQGNAALSVVDALLPEARAAGDSAYLLALLRRQGEVRASIGMAVESEPVLREVMTLGRALGDSIAVCEGLRWLGVALDGLGRVAEARELYDELDRTAAACGSVEHRGWAEVGRAWQDFRAGSSAESARRYRLAVGHFEACGSPRGLMWAENGLGNALTSLGEYGETLDCFRRTIDIARENGDLMAESMGHNNMGALAFSLGDYGQALENFESAHKLQRRIGYERGAFKPALNIALCLLKLRRFSEAEEIYESLLARCDNENLANRRGIVLKNMAELAGLRGRLHRARNLFLEVLAEEEHESLKHLVDVRLGLARVQNRLGDHEAALATLATGRREIEGRGLRNQELDLESLSALTLQRLGRHAEALEKYRHVDGLADRMGVTGFRVEALARIAASQRALGRADSSLATLRRAADLWETERGLPLDPIWREQRGQTGRLLYTDLALQLLAAERPADERERRREAFDQLQIFKARTLLERMLGPGNAAAASVGALEPITLDRLQWSVLREGELVLDVYLGSRASLLFAVTRDACRVLTLPGEDEIDEKLRRCFDLMSHPPAGDLHADLSVLHAAGLGLRRQLLGDVEDMIAAADLIFFTPDGALNLLTPAALGVATEEETANWARIPSVTVLARIRERGVGAGAPVGRILALAGDRNDSGVALPGAVREADMLSRRYRGVDCRLPGDGAYGDDGGLKVGDLVPYDLLHLAAHADVDDEHPWHSSLSFRGEGEKLYAADIAGARFDARLAVLAACESARGQVLSGEGVLGLSSAFISAGVPAVAATLWPVDDATTARLMERFYRLLAEGRPAAAALAGARERIRLDPATAHPFYWAGFVLVGDGLVDVPLSGRASPVRVTLIALAALAAAALARGLWRRRG